MQGWEKESCTKRPKDLWSQIKTQNKSSYDHTNYTISWSHRGASSLRELRIGEGEGRQHRTPQKQEPLRHRGTQWKPTSETMSLAILVSKHSSFNALVALKSWNTQNGAVACISWCEDLADSSLQPTGNDQHECLNSQTRWALSSMSWVVKSVTHCQSSIPAKSKKFKAKATWVAYDRLMALVQS